MGKQDSAIFSQNHILCCICRLVGLMCGLGHLIYNDEMDVENINMTHWCLEPNLNSNTKYSTQNYCRALCHTCTGTPKPYIDGHVNITPAIANEGVQYFEGFQVQYKRMSIMFVSDKNLIKMIDWVLSQPKMNNVFLKWGIGYLVHTE